MLLKIITIAILLVPILFLIKIFISFSMGINKMKDWSKFHKQLLEWSEEILDQEVKKEYLLHCVSLISSNGSMNIEGLKQEVRETRINKILN